MGQLAIPVISILSVLVILCSSIATINCSTHYCTCKQHERKALIDFKSSLIGTSNRLASWVDGEDCCNNNWEGVRCNNLTCNVVALDLSCHQHSNGGCTGLLSRELSPALSKLQHLEYLDLSSNFFLYSRIPPFIGSFNNLRYLNLSSTDFIGPIPPQMGNLTNLHVLDLSNSYSLRPDSLEWISGLRELQFLDMSSVNLSSTPSDSFQVFHQLLSLQHLGCSNCEVSWAHFSQLFANSTFASASSLRFLSFPFNGLDGPLPHSLANLSYLSYLDLKLNHFSSSISLLLGSKITLSYLDLRGNRFTGVEGVLDFMGRSCGLRYLDLSSNFNLGGDLEKCSSSSFSKCKKYELETLDMSLNKFSGSLSWLGNYTALKKLDLSNNFFSGGIPMSIGMLSSLTSMSLGNNSFSGNIPLTFGRLGLLDTLDLSRNKLSGVIRIDVFSNLSNLNHLALGSNSLVLETTHDKNNNNTLFPEWIVLKIFTYLDLSRCRISLSGLEISDSWSSLSYLDLSNNNIMGSLPNSLCNLTKLNYLNLARNNIIGHLPRCRWLSSISSLELADNQINGSLTESGWGLPSSLSSLNLANNLIGGHLPESICNMPYLSILVLRNNSLSGTIPNCLGNKSYLLILDLSSNTLSGYIPKSLWEISWLVMLNLSNNSLHGEIFMSNTSTQLVILDLSENQLSGSVPPWTGKQFYNLRILRLRSNRLVGFIPPQVCSLSQSLQIIDLANNHLTGVIPQCIENFRVMKFLNPTHNISDFEDFVSINEVTKGQVREYTTNLKLLVVLDLSCNKLVGIIPTGVVKLQALHGLNLSHNYLNGSIPLEIGKMRSLESLDLSDNHLSGSIPQSLSALNFLAHLNLSYNDLFGPIPTGNQLQTLDDPSVYFGNPKLCGDMLNRKCKMNNHAKSPDTVSFADRGKEQEGDHDEIWLYIFIISGFIVGFWAVIGTLAVKKTWRYAYFQLADRIVECLSMARVKKNLK